MTIIISGASGDLGQRVTKSLLETVPAAEIILLTRNPEALEETAAKGVQIRQADFDDTDTLSDAMQGGTVLLMISTLSIGRRVEQHNNAINAAKSAGVSHIVYTSSIGIQPHTPSISGQEHYATEQLIRASGLTFTILRNSWYAEVIPVFLLKPAIETGAMVMSTDNGCVAPVARQDCANAAAAVLANPDKHAGSVYEITGPALYNLAEIAALSSAVSGKSIKFVNVSHDEKQAIFDSLGVNKKYEEGMMSESNNAWASDEMVSYEMAIKQHYFSICSHHVHLITGKPGTSFKQVLQDNRHYYS
jgi:NAD(P)H dehydrogenase (quinone)